MNVLGLIPARGGSKGIPHKNLQTIDGKPLVSYTIEAAKESKKLDSVWVSTDSPDILEIANIYQVKIHNRKREHATDTSPVIDTAFDVLIEVEKLPDAVMLLQPTSPIRTGEDIDRAIELLENNHNASSVISVCPMHDIHPARMYWNSRGTLEPILKEYEELRRQDIREAYYRNGSIYLIKLHALQHTKSFMAKPIVPYVMPLSKLLNLDEPHDVIVARALIPAWKKGELE